MKRTKGIILIFQIITIPSLTLWVVVEFLIYLFKDLPFNWWSFGLLVTNVTLLALIVLVEIYKSINKDIKGIRVKLHEEQSIESKKSKFQERLDEAMKDHLKKRANLEDFTDHNEMRS